MLNKEDLIKRLRADPTYREALKMASNDDERRRIIATAEGFISGFVDSLLPGFSQISANSSLQEQLRQAIKLGARVVKEGDGKPSADPEVKDD